MKVFLDTNVLVYMHDHRESSKQHVAEELVRKAIAHEKPCISSQVVGEFCNVMRTKTDKMLPAETVGTIVSEFLAPLLAHTPSVDFYLRTLELHQKYSLSFYDALIVQAALDLGCTTLYSEDLQPGQTFGSLTIVNPFV